MKWFRRRDSNGHENAAAAAARAESEARERATRRRRQIVETLAEGYADLSAEELASRLRQAMTIVRPT